MKPYTCPKCNGEGTCDGQPVMGRAVTKCWPCQGSGVVWSNELDLTPIGPTWPYRGWPVQQPELVKNNGVRYYYSPCLTCPGGQCGGHEY